MSWLWAYESVVATELVLVNKGFMEFLRNENGRIVGIHVKLIGLMTKYEYWKKFLFFSDIFLALLRLGLTDFLL